MINLKHIAIASTVGIITVLSPSTAAAVDGVIDADTIAEYVECSTAAHAAVNAELPADMNALMTTNAHDTAEFAADLIADGRTLAEVRKDAAWITSDTVAQCAYTLIEAVYTNTATTK